MRLSFLKLGLWTLPSVQRHFFAVGPALLYVIGAIVGNLMPERLKPLQQTKASIEALVQLEKGLLCCYGPPVRSALFISSFVIQEKWLNSRRLI